MPGYSDVYSDAYAFYADAPPPPPFPQSPLDVRTELSLNGTWTDVSGFVNQGMDGLTITRGHPDESTTTTPSATELLFDNTTGRFSSKNPVGAFYPFLKRNVPLRMSVPDAGTYLRMEDDQMSFASTPDFTPIGDIDIRIDVQLSSYAPCSLAAKYQSSGNERSWVLALSDAGDGTLVLIWTTDGTEATFVQAESTVPIPLGRVSLRVTLSAATGTVTFFTGPPGDAATGPFTQLGATVVVGATSIFSSSASLVTGFSAGLNTDNPAIGGPAGKIYEFELRSGIGGTVVAHPVFSSETAGATSFTDQPGNVWTVSGTAELSARSYQFHGEAVGWPQAWDPTGIDKTVDVSASGVLRRLGQGQNPIESPMFRGITRATGTLVPVAYWPMEDAQGSTSFASGIGGPPMTIIGPVNLASDSTFAASQPLPVMNGGGGYGVVPPYASHGSIICRFLLNIQTGPANTARIMRVITTGTCMEFALYYGTGGALGLTGFDSGGNQVFDSGLLAFGVLNEPVWVSMELRPGGGVTVDWSFVTLQPGASTGLGFSGTFTGSIGNARAAIPAPTAALGQVTIGHVEIQSNFTSLFSLFGPLEAWLGETAGSRFIRLAAEESIRPRVYGFPGTSVAMGVQTLETLEALLQECVDADRGIMYEPVECLGLGYRTLASLCDQAPAVVPAYTQLNSPMALTEDDQTTLNDITVTNVDGSIARQQLLTGSLSVQGPPAGVGRYDTQISVNLASDSQLNDEAGWILNVSTVDQPRYPGISVDLSGTDVAAIFFAVLAVRIGDRIQVSATPAQVPPDGIDQLVNGVTLTMGVKTLRVSWACVPAAPYSVIVLDDLVLGREDTDGSTMHAAITATATAMQVDTADPLSPWTTGGTSGSDFPFDINVAGERITVTNIDGPPGNFLTGQNSSFDGGIGTWLGAGNAVTTPATSPVHSGTGSMRITSQAAGTASAAHCSAANILTQGLPCSPGDKIACGAWLFPASTARTCVAGAAFFNSAGAVISTLLGSPVSEGNGQFVKIPGTVTAPASAVACRLMVEVQATGAAGEQHAVDDAYLANLTTGTTLTQSFTVTRSVNGVVKAQAAGADVRLFTPPISALT